ncbi:hypothetical protein TURU_016915 [Turdus rufiventris]|nr:hypothetical protein TURU_016915 [Turdus rufiventris]
MNESAAYNPVWFIYGRRMKCCRHPRSVAYNQLWVFKTTGSDGEFQIANENFIFTVASTILEGKVAITLGDSSLDEQSGQEGETEKTIICEKQTMTWRDFGMLNPSSSLNYSSSDFCSRLLPSSIASFWSKCRRSIEYFVYEDVEKNWAKNGTLQNHTSRQLDLAPSTLCLTHWSAAYPLYEVRLIVRCALSGLQSSENCEPRSAVCKLSQDPRELQLCGGSRELLEPWPPGGGNREPAWLPGREKRGEAAQLRRSAKKRHRKAPRSGEKALRKSSEKALRKRREKAAKNRHEKPLNSIEKSPQKAIENWQKIAAKKRRKITTKSCRKAAKNRHKKLPKMAKNHCEKQ